VLDTPRNLSDAQLRALAERDGVLGVMVLPPAIDPEHPSIERVVDHIDHAVEVMGIDHVGLGADFFRQVALSGAVRKPPDSLRPPGMGMDYSIDDLAGPADYPRLVEALARRGYDEQAVAAVLRENFLRVFRRALPAGAA
jgi:membrane dipeptidase